MDNFPRPFPSVSVIIVNHDRRELLARCLHSLENQHYRNFEIIVVDNGSTDGSLDLLRADTRLGLIENRAKRGFCAANNQALKIARGHYIALLNNDAEVEANWLGELIHVMESDPGLGMVASKVLLHGAPDVIDKVGHLIYPDGRNRGRATGERDRGQYDELQEGAWPDGCAAFYRRSMLEQIGGFDEDFFAYADDAELGLRARIAGWRCIYVPSAVVYHRVAGTLGPYSEQRLFLIERNRIWLAGKLFPWRLLFWSPVYFALRASATVLAAVGGRGEDARAASSLGPFRLLKCIARANLAALAKLPAMLQKRAAIQSFRKLSPAEVAETIRRFQIPLRDFVVRTR